MGLKAINNLLGIEDMREELFSYCRATSCVDCLFKLPCDFYDMDEEEIEIYYALIFETDEMKREDKANLIYEVQWLKQHCHTNHLNIVVQKCEIIHILILQMKMFQVSMVILAVRIFLSFVFGKTHLNEWTIFSLIFVLFAAKR